MRVKVIGGFLLLAVVAYGVVSAVRTRPFSPADDLPRGALVYVQIEDLPGVIKLWNHSSFKNKYLQTENLDELSKRHLGLKIASRWQEFSDALGEPLDFDFVSSLADKRAAVAIYDIGKLDIVFIAPMNAATFEATHLMRSADKFENEALDDGTQIYRVDVDADKGRQKQQILFTHIKGRLIVATTEKLLAQTVSIITGRLKKNALADDPAFSTLAMRMTPKTAAVWVDQSALNADYYFRRYWLMSDLGSLKNFRSGMFNLSIGTAEATEDREFLLKAPASTAQVSSADAKQLMSRVPDSVPFFKIERADSNTLNREMASILDLDTAQIDKDDVSHRTDQDLSSYYDPAYGSDKFDEYIDDPDDESAIPRKVELVDLAGAFKAVPRAVLTLERSTTEAAPLFVKFDKAAVIVLSSPTEIDRVEFERSLSDALAARLLVRGQRLECQWVNRSEKGISWRELEAPILNWGIRYAIQGNDLIIANETKLLSEVLTTHGAAVNDTSAQFSELTVIQPMKLRNDFQLTFDRLAAKDDLFVGNILSLVDSAPEIEKVEIRRSSESVLMHEHLRMTLGSAPQQIKNAAE